MSGIASTQCEARRELKVLSRMKVSTRSIPLLSEDVERSGHKMRMRTTHLDLMTRNSRHLRRCYLSGQCLNVRAEGATIRRGYTQGLVIHGIPTYGLMFHDWLVDPKDTCCKRRLSSGVNNADVRVGPNAEKKDLQQSLTTISKRQTQVVVQSIC